MYMKRSVVLVIMFLACSALAVSPATWSHQTEKSFSSGEFKNTVINSLGQIRLSRRIDVLMKSDAAPSIVSAVVPAGKNVYAASGSDGKIYKIVGKEVSTLAELPSTMTLSLLWTGKDLLAGTAGDKAGVYRIGTDGKFAAVWTDPKVKYVWAIVPGTEGTLYAATGPEGKVFEIDLSAADKAPQTAPAADKKGAIGKAEVVFEAGKLAKNILCLVRSDVGKLYAGTDEKGLVIEIDPAKKTSRILLDAPEKEIAALLLDADGGLFAATSDAAKANADGAAASSTTKAGKLEKPAVTTKPGKAKTKPAPTTEPAGSMPAIRPAVDPSGKRQPDTVKQPGTAERSDTKASKRERPVRRLIAVINIETQPAPTTGRAEPTSAAKPMQMSRPAIGPPVRRRPPSGMRPGAAAPSGPGNAVYYIASDGLVRTVFRRPLTILAMQMCAGKLLLGTGNGGDIYTVTTDGDEIARIADTDAKQVTALAVDRDGRIFFATSNKGSVGVLAKGFATEGVFTSKALDAKQIARWGTLRVRLTAADGPAVTISTRSGNVAEPDDKTWSSWSKDSPATEGFLAVGSPAGRFIQYRLKLSSKGDSSPMVEGVQIIYQVGNLWPVVAGVQVTASAKGGSQRGSDAGAKAYRIIAIKASDPNGDALRYKIEFRRIGTTVWIEIVEKLTEPKYVWDTRRLGDGRYELRVTASDEPANPLASALKAVRISEPVVVDNTAPLVKDLGARCVGDTARVSGKVADASSRITAIQYAVNSQKEWTLLLPADGICDSDSEAFAFKVEELKAGTHRIAVRVVDLYGNVGFGAVTVTVAQ